jgi:outer membrane murein-binding lipoprotein Lpp
MGIDYSRIRRSRSAVAIVLGVMLLSLAVPTVAAQPELKITVNVQSEASPGSKVSVGIVTSFDGSLVDATINTAHVWRPDFTPPPTFLPAPTRFETGHFNTTWVVPEDATLGLYFVHVLASFGTTSEESSAPIRITAGDPDHLDDFLHQTFVKLDALEGSIVDFRTAVGASLNSITSALDALGSSVDAVSTTVSGLSTALSGLSADIRSVNAGVSGVGTDVDALRSDVSAGVGSLTTLVYIAITLSVITLILQVVVMTRKR